jgi:hypothetical protein
MITILSALVSLLSFRVRSRASLELEVVALRHQVAVLRRQRLCADRLLWVLAISGLAAGLARDGAGETGNGGPVASQGLPALLAVAIKIAPDWPAEDEHRDRFGCCTDS